MMDKLIYTITYVLSIPLLVFHGLLYIVDEVMTLNTTYSDYFFMKKLNIKDQAMFEAYMEWRQEYEENTNEQ